MSKKKKTSSKKNNTPSNTSKNNAASNTNQNNAPSNANQNNTASNISENNTSSNTNKNTTPPNTNSNNIPKGQLEGLTALEIESLPHSDVYEMNGEAFYVREGKNGMTQTISLGRAIRVECKTYDMDTAKSIITLRNSIGTYHDLLPSKIAPDNMIELADYGFDVTYQNRYGYYYYISNLVYLASEKYSHSYLGWKKFKNKLIFLLRGMLKKVKMR